MTSILNSKKIKPAKKRPGRPRKELGVDALSDGLKQQILNATTELISRKGFGGFTLRDVAQEVGVHTALVGYYFGTKSKLERTALEDQIKKSEALMAKVKTLEDKPSSYQDLKELFLATIKSVMLDETRYRFALWVLANGGSLGTELSERIYSPWIQTIARLIRKHLPQATAVECEARAALFFNLTNGCNRLYWSYLKDLRLESDRDRFLSEYLKLVEEKLLPGVIS